MNRKSESRTTECKCGSRMVLTINTRNSQINGYPSVIRRKMCADCKHRWSTHEMHVDVLKAMVYELKAINRFKKDVAKIFT